MLARACRRSGFAPAGGGAKIKPELLPPSAGRRELLISPELRGGKCEGRVPGRYCSGGCGISKGVLGEVKRQPPKGGFGPLVLLALRTGGAHHFLPGPEGGQWERRVGPESDRIAHLLPPPDFQFLVDVLQAPGFSKPV